MEIPLLCYSALSSVLGSNNQRFPTLLLFNSRVISLVLPFLLHLTEQLHNKIKKMQKGAGRKNLSHFIWVLPPNPDQHLHISQSTHRQMVYAWGKRKSIWRGRKYCIRNDLIFTMTPQRRRDKTTWTTKKFKKRKDVKRISKEKKKKKKD